MKNISIKIDNMGNAHVTADKHEILVMPEWCYNEYSKDYYCNYAVTSTFGFKCSGADEWSLNRRINELEQTENTKILRALLEAAKAILATYKPEPLPETETITEE